MMSDFDVVVVGASIAGSALSYQLASQGVRVALLERAIFPRPKVCGEGLSQSAVRLLHDAGLSDVLHSIPFQLYEHFVLHDRRPHSTQLGTQGQPLGMGVMRENFDFAIFQKAAAHPNVFSKQGILVDAIRQDANNVTVSTKSETFTAPFVIIASGSKEGFGLPMRRISQSNIRFGFSFRVSGIPRNPLNSVHAFLREGFQVLCTPVAEQTLNISVLITKHRVARDIQILHDQALTIVSDFFEQCEVASETLSCGAIGRAVRPPVHGRILLAGDACEQFDPIGGMGMTHALLCANLAARAVQNGLCHPDAYAEHLAKYAHQRELAVRPLRGFTRLSISTLTKDSWFGMRLRRNTHIAQLVSSAVHGVCSDGRCAVALGLLAFLGRDL